MILLFSPAALDARFVGGLQAFIDNGLAAARVRLYSSATAGSGLLLAELVLTKPAGALVAGQFVLSQADTDGDLIALNGTPLSGRLLNGAGEIVCDGDVTAASGDGVFKVEGDDGTAQLYAGGRARLLNSYFF